MIMCGHGDLIHATWIEGNPLSLIEKNSPFSISQRMEILSERLKMRIEEIGVTQIRAAQLAGISPQRMGNYVQGTRSPDILTLSKIAHGLGVSADWLLGLTDNGAINDISPVVRRLLELDGMSPERAIVLSEVAQEAVKLLSTLSDDAPHPAKAHMAAQAVWNSRPQAKPS